MPQDLFAPQNISSQPRDLFAEQNITQQMPQEQKPVIDIGSRSRLLADILAGGAAGGQSLHNLPYALINIFSHEAAQKYMPQPTNIDFAKLIGAKQNVPEKLLRGAISYAPYAMTGGISIPGQALAGGAAGAAEMPESPVLGGTLGAALGAGGMAIPKAGAAFNFMRPQKYLNESIEQLGGSKNVNDITKSLSKDIKAKADSIHETYKEKLAPVENSMGDKNLYETPNGAVERTYSPLSKEYEGLDLGGAKKAHENFIENPTYANADELQKALGAEARSIKGIERNSTIARNQIYQLRNDLKNDIHNSLDKYDPTKSLSNMYKDASNFYLKEYVPYKNIKTLTDVMGKKGATSTSLLGAFKNPKISAEEGTIPDALKVANDLGDSGKNKIIALELAKRKSLKPDSALKAWENLETTGLSEYETPTLQKIMETLARKNTAKKIAQKTGKVAGIAGAGYLGVNELRKYFGGLL